MHSQVLLLLVFVGIAQGFFVPRPRVIKVPFYQTIYKPFPVYKKVPVFKKQYVPIVKPVKINVPHIVPVYVEKEVHVPVYIEKEVPMKQADPSLDLGIIADDADSITINANVNGLGNVGDINGANTAADVNIVTSDADQVNIDVGVNGAFQGPNADFAQSAGMGDFAGKLNNAVALQ